MSEKSWMQRCFRIIREQDGHEVQELLASHSDTKINAAKTIASLEKQLEEWKVKCELAATEIKELEKRCSSLENEVDKRRKTEKIVKVSRCKSEIFTESERAKEMSMLSESLRKELAFRDRIMGVVSFKDPCIKQKYRLAVTGLVEERDQCVETIETLEDEKKELQEQLEIKDRALNYSQASWKIIYLELSDLFSKLDTEEFGCRKRIRRDTFGQKDKTDENEDIDELLVDTACLEMDTSSEESEDVSS